jgi:hypothetical protein
LNLKIGSNETNDDSATIAVEIIAKSPTECPLTFPGSLKLICCDTQRKRERWYQPQKNEQADEN